MFCQIPLYWCLSGGSLIFWEEGLGRKIAIFITRYWGPILSTWFIYLFIYLKNSFIYLVALGLSCGRWAP